ncbi:putative F-box protein [Cinnamomum micranthum f. kanehirae]|uniref:Putative F-box protein n=1 Tax=Cinnamomum micranthum f. kanehirae TaxID=337451 RepID=A0A443P2B2_9MAGN|nr:putative F-box protein [Cinnamomum micranthum f. kanehirae]
MFPSAVFTKLSFCFLSSLNLETPGRRLLYMLDRMPNWVDLHKVLLERIRDFCPILDQIQMQLVCKPWCSTLKHAHLNELPWLMMLPNNKSEEEEKENPPPDVDARLFYSLSKQQIHTIPLPEIRGKRCCGSLQNGWLMIVDDKLDISLFHPWSKKKVDLPYHSTFKRDSFECGIYHIRSAISDDGNVLVFLYGFGHLAFWRIGNAAYTDIRSGIDESMDDVIYHKGQFYAVSQKGAVYLLHVEEGFLPCGEKLTLYLEDFPICYWQYRYLVPDILTDSMFVIARKGLER